MIVFDGHTHIYDCYDLDRFFLAAFNNLSLAAGRLQAEGKVDYFLLMAEATGVYYFNRLKEMAKESTGTDKHPWRVELAEESYGLELSHSQYPAMRVTLVAGRQLITEEKLELLALMTDEDFEDGQDLASTINAVVVRGAVPVCPWGAGKWLGNRGKVLENYLKDPHPHFSLGDSGGRPSLWPRPAVFNSCLSSARTVSGSDPLPLVGDEKRAGSFGGTIDAVCPEVSRGSFLRALLIDTATRVSPYGSTCNSLQFVRNQVALRLN